MSEPDCGCDFKGELSTSSTADPNKRRTPDERDSIGTLKKQKTRKEHDDEPAAQPSIDGPFGSEFDHLLTHSPRAKPTSGSSIRKHGKKRQRKGERDGNYSDDGSPHGPSEDDDDRKGLTGGTGTSSKKTTPKCGKSKKVEDPRYMN